MTVNKDYQEEYGQNYHGSKDIDLGFHIDRSWNINQLKSSPFTKSVTNLEKEGFIPISQRYVKHFKEDGTELSEQASKKVSHAFMFDLFVDPIVDNMHDDIKEVVGFTPIDEPLLSQVFLNKKCTILKLSDVEVVVPNPEVLLATKINSVNKRTKDHKRIKDIADIYVLIPYSNIPISSLRRKLLNILNKRKIIMEFEKFTKDDYANAGNALGLDPFIISNVVRSFIR